MSKEIDHDVELLKKDIRSERMFLGPYPLTDSDEHRWQQICESNREFVKTINSKINKYNLIVPLINRQKFYVEIDKILDDILRNGPHSVELKKVEAPEIKAVVVSDDFIGSLWKIFEDIFAFGKQKKTEHNKEKFRN